VTARRIRGADPWLDALGALMELCDEPRIELVRGHVDAVDELARERDAIRGRQGQRARQEIPHRFGHGHVFVLPLSFRSD
jgi:hypothetical protein